MKHYRRYILGSSKDVPTDRYDETVRICHQTMHYNTTIVDIIGGAFLKAQLLNDEGIINEPFALRVVVPESSLKKFKLGDSNTAIERIEWYILNSMPPTNGIIIDLFTSDKINPYVETPWAMNRLWVATRQWEKCEDSDYVTINFPDGPISNWKSNRVLESLEQIKMIVENFDMGVKLISYKIDVEEAAKLMLGAKCHFTYIGGTYSQAAFLGIPTIAVGKAQRRHVNMSSDPISGEISEELVDVSMYGHAQMCSTKIAKYDHTNKMVRNGPIGIAHIKGADSDDISKLSIGRYVL